MILNPAQEGAIVVATFVWLIIAIMGAIAMACTYISSTTKIEPCPVPCEDCGNENHCICQHIFEREPRG
jgi:hypothetical protein